MQADKREMARAFVERAMAATKMKASQLAKKSGVSTTTLTRGLKQDWEYAFTLSTLLAVSKAARLDIPKELLDLYNNEAVAAATEYTADAVDFDALEAAIESVFVYAKRTPLPPRVFAERVVVAYRTALEDRRSPPAEAD